MNGPLIETSLPTSLIAIVTACELAVDQARIVRSEFVATIAKNVEMQKSPPVKMSITVFPLWNIECLKPSKGLKLGS